VKKYIICLIIVVVLIALICFLYWQNNDIVINNIEYKNKKIPKNFDGYKILQISDLHNKEFGKKQSDLVQYTKEIDPDIIVITGDIIDKRRTTKEDLYIGLEYIKQLNKEYPIYFVTGNHEVWRPKFYPEVRQALLTEGVIILENETYELELNGEKISLLGINDIAEIDGEYITEKERHKFRNILNGLVNKEGDNFKILLSHRPELINIYAEEKVDLTFTGHAHGGQIRLPFTEGLFAPNQGVLPKYTSGIHYQDESAMVVSRGLGASIFPFRIFNRPEMVVVTLKR